MIMKNQFKKNCIVISLFVAIISIMFSCTNDERGEEYLLPTYEAIDLGVKFTKYEPGKTYVSDSILNNFKITNYGTQTFKKGDKVRMGATLDEHLFGIDLTTNVPTLITLQKDLPPGESFDYNPGYLYGPLMIQYFQKEKMVVNIMVYGVNDLHKGTSFESDINPGNNITSLTYNKDSEIYLNP